jgi:hypothetical protein
MVSDDEGPLPTFQSITSILEHQLRGEPTALADFESLLAVVASDEDFETEQDAIDHLIDIAEMELDNWRILRMACGWKRNG